MTLNKHNEFDQSLAPLNLLLTEILNRAICFLRLRIRCLLVFRTLDMEYSFAVSQAKSNRKHLDATWTRRENFMLDTFTGTAVITVSYAGRMDKGLTELCLDGGQCLGSPWSLRGHSEVQILLHAISSFLGFAPQLK